jgi:hypothetical protein
MNKPDFSRSKILCKTKCKLANLNLVRAIRFRLHLILWTCCLLLVWQQIANAQNGIQVPNYVPQSPVAAAYSRYGEIPVDFSTGVPKIEIPIYNLKVGDSTIPITISYHASGIKVRDVASEIGLGWVINIGGVVTANILGIPDVLDSRPFSYKQSSDITTAINSTTDPTAVYDLTTNYWKDLNEKYHVLPIDGSGGVDLIDYYSDRFYYSLCTGENGIFRKDFVSNAIRKIPYRPVSINMDLNSVNIISSTGDK